MHLSRRAAHCDGSVHVAGTDDPTGGCLLDRPGSGVQILRGAVGAGGKSCEMCGVPRADRVRFPPGSIEAEGAGGAGGPNRVRVRFPAGDASPDSRVSRPGTDTGSGTRVAWVEPRVELSQATLAGVPARGSLAVLVASWPAELGYTSTLLVCSSSTVGRQPGGRPSACACIPSETVPLIRHSYWDATGFRRIDRCRPPTAPFPCRPRGHCARKGTSLRQWSGSSPP